MKLYNLIKYTLATALVRRRRWGSRPRKPSRRSSDRAGGGASFAAPADLALTVTTADIDGTVTNVAYYQGTTLLGNATAAPFSFTTANLSPGATP